MGSFFMIRGWSGATRAAQDGTRAAHPRTRLHDSDTRKGTKYAPSSSPDGETAGLRQDSVTEFCMLRRKFVASEHLVVHEVPALEGS